MEDRNRRHLMRFLCCMLALFVFIGFILLIVLACSIAVDRRVRTCPSYAREELFDVAKKEAFTEEDYTFLRLQTGLSKTAINALASGDGASLIDILTPFQDALFFDGDFLHAPIGACTFHDLSYDAKTGEIYSSPLALLEAGDVLVTSSTHTLGYRHGHCALVLEGGVRILEAPSSDRPSKITRNASFFSQSVNFIVLRLKREEGESADDYAARRLAIAKDAEAHLVGIRYSVTAGIFSKKDQGRSPSVTQCAHLVWQAFKNFGYDIDCDGGPVCTPRDVARSPLFERIQICGFDVEKGW